MQQVFRENHSENLKVLLVWEPILPTDWFRPSRFVQRRISDSRATQFWDKDHLVAKALRAHLSDPQVEIPSHNGILWDVVAVFAKDTRWNSAPTFIRGPVVRVISGVENQLATRSSSLP